MEFHTYHFEGFKAETNMSQSQLYGLANNTYSFTGSNAVVWDTGSYRWQDNERLGATNGSPQIEDDNLLSDDDRKPDPDRSSANEGILVNGAFQKVQSVGCYVGSTVTMDDNSSYQVNVTSVLLQDGTLLLQLPDGVITNLRSKGYGSARLKSIKLAPSYREDVARNPTRYNDRFICFAAGTLVETEAGLRQIDTLQEGDLVRTRDHGLQPLRWIGSRSVIQQPGTKETGQLPVLIEVGALGPDRPQRELMLSQQHRVLLNSPICRRMFSSSEVLVAAKELLALDGVRLLEECTSIKYFHLLFDRHEIICANGLETELLFTGPEALKMLGSAARDEILELMPDLAAPDYQPEPARPIIRGPALRRLIARHLKNEQPVCQVSRRQITGEANAPGMTVDKGPASMLRDTRDHDPRNGPVLSPLVSGRVKSRRRAA